MPTAAAVSRSFETEGGALALSKSLPKPAQDKLESLRRIERRARALIEGLREELQRVVENRHDAERQLGRFDRDHAGMVSWEDNEETGGRVRVPLRDPEREAIVARIAELKGEADRIRAEQAASDPGFSVQHIMDWLTTDHPSTKFVMVSSTKIAKSENLLSALERNRDAQATLRDQLVDVENRPLTVSEAKASMRAEIAAMAERGKPDITPLFHGQSVHWATELFVAGGNGTHPHVVATTITDAVALAAWANHDAIVAKLDALIDAAASGPEAMSREEQARQIAERQASLLLAQRQEDAIISKLEEAGQMIRRQCVDPLVLLGIEPVK